MCQKLMSIQVPVAVSMLQLAKTVKHPFHEFVCYWTAFNNIYAVVAINSGQRPERKKKDKMVCGVQIPAFRSNESRQIRNIRGQLCPDLKHELIMHENTNWFVNRTPKWNGQPIVHDAQGHELNGVINVGFTLDDKSPVWSPICSEDYQNYKKNPQPKTQDELAEQIVDVLYTTRNNLIHAGKEPGDATDEEVTMKAIPLLQLIISHFLS